MERAVPLDNPDQEEAKVYQELWDDLVVLVTLEMLEPQELMELTEL